MLASERMGAAFALLRSSRPDLGAGDHHVRARPARVDERPDGVECRRHAHAGAHAQRIPGAPVPAQRAGARARSRVAGERIDLAALTLPMFVVGTETDHVAPWRSVYKARGLTRSNDYTFLLTSGGHNAGIISGPQHPKRRHRVAHWQDTQRRADTRRVHAAGRTAAGLLVADVAAVARSPVRAAAGGSADARQRRRRLCGRRGRPGAIRPRIAAARGGDAADEDHDALRSARAHSQLAMLPATSRCARALTYMPMCPTSSAERRCSRWLPTRRSSGVEADGGTRWSCWP